MEDGTPVVGQFQFSHTERTSHAEADEHQDEPENAPAAPSSISPGSGNATESSDASYGKASTSGVNEIVDKLNKKTHSELVTMNCQMYSMLSHSLAESKDLKAHVVRLETQLKSFHGQAAEIVAFKARCNELEVLLEESARRSEFRSKPLLGVSRANALNLPHKPTTLRRCQAQTIQLKPGVSMTYPTVAGLPPTGMYPGKPPGLAPGAKQVPKKSGALGAVAASLFRRFQSKQPKQAEGQPLKQREPKPSHNRLPLYWQGQGKEAQVSAVPPQPSTQPGASIKVGGVNPTDQGGASIFTTISKGSSTEQLLQDPNLDLWFTRHKPDVVATQTPKPDKVAIEEKGVRQSVLGVALTKKYGITVRCLTKAFGRWDAFKSAVLLCQLGRPEIDLLLDTVPDPESSRGTRRLHEWEEAVSKVAEFRKNHPLEPLYPDEEFVAYISSVPDLHQRLECMVVMKSFQQLLQRVEADIETLMDAIEVLLKNAKIPTLFAAILCIGNYLNEGTSLGDKHSFKLMSLRKVAELRGQGPNSRSLLYFLASHLGQVVSPAEARAISKAGKCSVAQVVQNASRIHDIFNLLSDRKIAEEKKLFFERKRRQSIRPDEDDVNDKFIEIGREFVCKHKEESDALRADVRRLLQDYYCLAEYFGDCESFIPIDRKIEDERNPGQLRFIPDIFTVFSSFFDSYQSSLKEIIAGRERKAAKRDLGIRRPKEAGQARTAKPSEKIDALGLAEPSPLSSEASPPSPVLSDLSISNLPRSPRKMIEPSPLPEICKNASDISNTVSEATDMGDMTASSPRPIRRASMRPSLFPMADTQPMGGLDQLVRLEAVKEFVSEPSFSHDGAFEKENIPVPMPKEATREVSFPEDSLDHESTLANQAKRRRESLREMAGLLALQTKVDNAKARSGLPAQPFTQQKEPAIPTTSTRSAPMVGRSLRLSGVPPTGTSISTPSFRGCSRGVAVERQLSPLREVEEETPHTRQSPYGAQWRECGENSAGRQVSSAASSHRSRGGPSSGGNALTPEAHLTDSTTRLQQLRAEAAAALRRSKERRAIGF